MHNPPRTIRAGRRPRSSTRSATASRACAACRSGTSSSRTSWTCCRASFRGSRCSARCHPSPASSPGSSRCSRRATPAQSKPLTQALKAVAAELGTDLAKIAGDPANAVERLAPLKVPLTQLCATYLLQRAGAGEPAQDPVARFHLNNGAKLERINWLADPSRKGLRRIARHDGQLPVRAQGDRGKPREVRPGRDRRFAAGARPGASGLTFASETGEVVLDGLQCVMKPSCRLRRRATAARARGRPPA